LRLSSLTIFSYNVLARELRKYGLTAISNKYHHNIVSEVDG
ncbi:hypothetical protein X975_23176, partial [Stegodyphus mimosarum]